jgi:hypothetical protein
MNFTAGVCHRAAASAIGNYRTCRAGTKGGRRSEQSRFRAAEKLICQVGLAIAIFAHWDDGTVFRVAFPKHLSG